jgi:hypothetical protein
VEKLLLACASSLVLFSLIPCWSAEERQTGRNAPVNQPAMFKGGVEVEDVHSKGYTFLQASGEDAESIEAVICGDRVLFHLTDGQTIVFDEHDVTNKPPQINPKFIPQSITSCMFANFKTKKKVLGQANLTLLVKSDHTFEILTKAIYVPGCKVYTGDTAVPQEAQEFWEQIKSAVATIRFCDLTLSDPQIKSEVFELIIGRDLSVFPRHGTHFDGMIRRDTDGNIDFTRVNASK